MLVQKTTKNPIKPAGYGFLERFLLVKCTVGWSVHLMWFWICWFFERWKTHTKWKVKPRSHQDIYLVWTLQHMLAELSQTHTSPHSGFNTHDSLQKAIDKPQLWRIWQIHHKKILQQQLEGISNAAGWHLCGTVVQFHPQLFLELEQQWLSAGDALDGILNVVCILYTV